MIPGVVAGGSAQGGGPPPTGNFSYVSEASAENAIVNLSTFTPGDIAIVLASDDRVTGITVPGGWTSVVNLVSNGAAMRVGYRVLQSGDTNTGTWSGARIVAVVVYRANSGVPTIGNVATYDPSNNSLDYVTYPALTPADGSGDSWIIGLGSVRAVASAVGTPPTGMVNRAYQFRSTRGDVAIHDSDSGRTSWSATNVAIASGTVKKAATIELRTT